MGGGGWDQGTLQSPLQILLMDEIHGALDYFAQRLRQRNIKTKKPSFLFSIVRRSSEGCGAAHLGCGAAQVGCGATHLGCGAAQVGCSAAQRVRRNSLRVRRSSGRVQRSSVRMRRSSDSSASACCTAWPEFKSRLGTPGRPSTERRAMRKQEWTLGEWMYE